MLQIRPAMFAGKFYPDDEDKLQKDIEDYLDKAQPKNDKRKLRALIVPHAGYKYSAPVAAYAYKVLKEYSVEKIIILGLSHNMAFPGLGLSNFSHWRTPLGLIRSINISENFQNDMYIRLLNESHLYEHSIEVQLPFIQSVQEDANIIPISTGRSNDIKDLAKSLKTVIDNDTILIVSSDLSHYLSYEDANERDKETIEKILKLKSDIKGDEACGAVGINILIELAKLSDWEPELLDYRNSGDTSGDKDKVVGYSSIAFYRQD